MTQPTPTNAAKLSCVQTAMRRRIAAAVARREHARVAETAEQRKLDQVEAEISGSATPTPAVGP